MQSLWIPTIARSLGFAAWTAATLMLAAWTAPAATFYTSTEGNDGNPGTAELPWLTIRRGIQAVAASDTLVVRAGSYPERVSSVRGGLSATSRITFRADGKVVLIAWRIAHPFVTLDGFDFVGQTGGSVLDSYVRVDRGGDQFQMLRCAVRDATQLIVTNLMFDAATRRLISPGGGFLAAGFAVSNYIVATSAITLTNIESVNSRILLVSEVSDTALTVTNRLIDQGPLSALITANPVYGLYLDSRTKGALVQGCTFRNLGYDAWFIFGTNHVIEGNVVEQVNGWDAMHFGGTDLLFRRNIIRDSPLKVLQGGPDALENYSPNPYNRVVFKNNAILGFQGVIAAQKGGNSSSNWFLLRNVFFDTGWLSLSHPMTRIEQNTFVRCAKFSSPVISLARHAITLLTSMNPGTGIADASNSILRNNVFVDCGQTTSATRPDQIGWYEVKGPPESIVAEGNFVAGAPPAYGPKTGWPESAALNGGDPMFVDSSNPLGPDGLPFTADDGLRPAMESRLVGAGVGGRTVGAYEPRPATSPEMRVQRLDGTSLKITWPDGLQDWTLETAISPAGPWHGYPAWPVVADGQVAVTVAATDALAFFRLAE